MILQIILIILGFILLIKGADFLVKGGSNIAKRFHIPEIVIRFNNSINWNINARIVYKRYICIKWVFRYGNWECDR